MVTLAHLRPEIQALAALPGAERLAGLNSEHWIGYTRAHWALAQLEALLTHEFGKIRPRNLLIVGPTNNGKTMTPKNFIGRIRRIPPRTASTRSFPSSGFRCLPNPRPGGYTSNS